MDIRKLQRAIVDGLEDVKAQHIAVFNTEHLSSMFERVIIASGTSNRQTKALAASVRNSVKGRGMQVMSTEGEDNGEWIIVDCGAAVAHIMQPAVREYYHLEEIWGGKAVRMKVGEINTKLVKASEPERLPAKTPRKTARPAAAPLSAKPAAPAKPGVSRKAAKTEADKKMANRTAAFKRVAAKAPSKRSRRESSAPATQTVVVKAAGKVAAKAVGKSVGKSVGKAPARKAAPRKAQARSPRG